MGGQPPGVGLWWLSTVHLFCLAEREAHGWHSNRLTALRRTGTSKPSDGAPTPTPGLAEAGNPPPPLCAPGMTLEVPLGAPEVRTGAVRLDPLRDGTQARGSPLLTPPLHEITEASTA